MTTDSAAPNSADFDRAFRRGYYSESLDLPAITGGSYGDACLTDNRPFLAFHKARESEGSHGDSPGPRLVVELFGRPLNHAGIVQVKALASQHRLDYVTNAFTDDLTHDEIPGADHRFEFHAPELADPRIQEQVARPLLRLVTDPANQNPYDRQATINSLVERAIKQGYDYRTTSSPYGDDYLEEAVSYRYQEWCRINGRPCVLFHPERETMMHYDLVLTFFDGPPTPVVLHRVQALSEALGIESLGDLSSAGSGAGDASRSGTSWRMYLTRKDLHGWFSSRERGSVAAQFIQLLSDPQVCIPNDDSGSGPA